MNGTWNRLRQWMYPSAFRIDGGDPRAGLLILELADELEEIKKMVSSLPAQPVQPQPPVGGAAAPAKVDKDFVVGICNHMARLERSARQSGDSDRVRGHLDRLRKTLEDYGVNYEDLTGQAYTSGRRDFEPLGEPQVRPDLNRDTIVQCERPVVLIKGELAQKARGVVGTPAG